MKLKKMMALALSGVLAVSMLTACDTGSVNGGASSGDGGNGVVTGYSSVLAKYMEKSTKKDYVTFQDNNADAEALEDALGNRGSLLLNGNTLAPVVMPVVSPVISNDFKNNLGLDVVVTDVVNGVFGDWDQVLNVLGLKKNDGEWTEVGSAIGDVNTTKKIGMIFVVDGTISLEKALKQIADGASTYINEIEKMPYDYFMAVDQTPEWNRRVDLVSLDTIVAEHLPEKATTCLGETYEYNYTVSASVVNKALTVVDGYHGTANFIAVTITRTVK